MTNSFDPSLALKKFPKDTEGRKEKKQPNQTPKPPKAPEELK